MTQKELADRLREIVPAQPTKKETVERAVRELIKELDPPPALEPGRLYYAWNKKDEFRQKFVRLGDDTDANDCDHIEPVHQRWGELTSDERGEFMETVNDHRPELYYTGVYKKAYRLITGEDDQS